MPPTGCGSPTSRLSTRYCRAVAGTVGPARGPHLRCRRGRRLRAAASPAALQLVNILRDVEEDAARDRVYLPRSRLAGAGHPRPASAAAVVGHPLFARAWTQLAEEAELPSSPRPSAMLAGLDRRRLRPALLMLWSYRPLLERLRRQGWQPGPPPHAPRPGGEAASRLDGPAGTGVTGRAACRRRRDRRSCGGPGRGTGRPAGRALRGDAAGRWPLPGSRGRDGAASDNGTHVLLGANRACAALPGRHRRPGELGRARTRRAAGARSRDRRGAPDRPLALVLAAAGAAAAGPGVRASSHG